MSLEEALLKILEREVAKKAIELRNAVIEELSKAGTGRVYKRRSVLHRASAPWKPPAVDTGRLRGSIAMRKMGPLHFRVFTNVEYANIEFGTEWIIPRPFFRPAIAKVMTGVSR